MTQIYKVTYRALSPIHIGYKSIGILDTTRYYVTGKAIWGAITAIVTRHLIDSPASRDYTGIGEFVKRNIKATYFFPGVNNTLYHPVYEKGELKYGRSSEKALSKNAFEKIFIYSFVSTALDKTRTADENTLHEVEYIKNRVRIANDLKDVHWIGYFFVNEKPFSANGEKELVLNMETEEEDFRIKKEDREVKASEIFRQIQVGGERNYGFGKLELEGSLEKVDGKNGKVFNCELDGDGIKSEIALGHVYYRNIPYVGDVEPLVGREWCEKGSGRKITLNEQGENVQGIFFVPGTSFERELRFDVKDYGVWNCIV